MHQHYLSGTFFRIQSSLLLFLVTSSYNISNEISYTVFYHNVEFFYFSLFTQLTYTNKRARILESNKIPITCFRFFGALQGIPDGDMDKEIFSICSDLNMKEKMRTRSKNLSGGTKRKTSLAIALIGNHCLPVTTLII